MLTLLTLSLAVMRRRVLESRLANDESPIVTARVQIGSAFFLLFCFYWFVLFLLLFLFFTSKIRGTYTSKYSPHAKTELRIPESWKLSLVECSVALCNTYRTLQ